jgi:hypothetical protein
MLPVDDVNFETRLIESIQGWVRILRARRTEFLTPRRQAALRNGFSNPLLLLIRNRRSHLTVLSFAAIERLKKLAYFTNRMVSILDDWRVEVEERN